MTVSKNLEIYCNSCHETETWSIDVLRDRSIELILENHGYTTKYHGWSKGSTHWCPDCNERTKNTYYVIGGRGEEYLGEIKAWGIHDARRVAWDTFDQENMVKREKRDAMERVKQ